MLTPEAARERLEAQKVKGWKSRRAARMATLGPRASLAAAAVLKDDPYGWGERRQDCGPALEGLSTRQRTALFGAFLPGLGEHAQRMWADGVRRPYQSGWARRAFRAPNDPAVTLDARRDAFLQLVHVLEGFEAKAVWVAQWAPHLSWNDQVSPLLAAVIDGGGEEGRRVFEALIASAEGTDEIGTMGRHVAAALLIANREDGWEYVERLLLAAQRQEGLRQAILEAADEAHPEAFRRLLALILEHGLTRFSATVRALDVWLGFAEGAGDRRRLDGMLERLLRYIDDEQERAVAIAGGEPEDAYLALWSAAYQDAPATVALAQPLLGEADVERRWVFAALAFGGTAAGAGDVPADVFERLERLLARIGKARTELDPIVWPWTGATFDRTAVAGRLRHALDKRPPSRLIPHLKAMEPFDRAATVTVLAGGASSRGDARVALLTLVGDASPDVRERAISAAAKLEVTDAETVDLEALLTRKAGDLRRGVIALLLARGDERALASAERLLASKSAEQRLGGLEVLRRLADEGRAAARSRGHAETYRNARATLTEAEKTQLDAILGRGEAGLPSKASRDDCFGLRDQEGETRPRSPSGCGVALATKAALRVLEELDALVHEHRHEEIVAQEWWGATEKLLLADAGWRFPRVARFVDGERGIAAAEELPLREVWERWLSARPDATRDSDGCELLRASVLPLGGPDPYLREQAKAAGAKAVLDGVKPPQLRHGLVVQAIVEWLAYLHPPENAVGFLLDAAETLLTATSPRDFVDKSAAEKYGWLGVSSADDLSEEELEAHFGYAGSTWRDEGWLACLEFARTFALLRPNLWGTEDYHRLWSLERWVELPPEHADAERGIAGRLGLKRRKRLRPQAPPLESLLVTYRAGAATDADAIVYLLGPGDRRSRLNALSGATVAVSSSPPKRVQSRTSRSAV